MKQIKNEQFANLTVNHFTTVVGKNDEFLFFVNINVMMRESKTLWFGIKNFI